MLNEIFRKLREGKELSETKRAPWRSKGKGGRQSPAWAHAAWVTKTFIVSIARMMKRPMSEVRELYNAIGKGGDMGEKRSAIPAVSDRTGYSVEDLTKFLDSWEQVEKDMEQRHQEIDARLKAKEAEWRKGQSTPPAEKPEEPPQEPPDNFNPNELV